MTCSTERHSSIPLRKAAHALNCSFVLLLPLLLPLWHGGTTALPNAVMRIATCIGFLLMLMGVTSTMRVQLCTSRMLWLVFAWLLLPILAWQRGPYAWMALQNSLIFIIALGVAALVLGYELQVWLRRGILLSAFLQGSLALLTPLFATRGLRASGTFVDPNNFGAFCAVVAIIPLSTVLTYVRRRRFDRRLLLHCGATILCLGGAVTSASRSALVAFICGSTLLVLSLGRKVAVLFFALLTIAGIITLLTNNPISMRMQRLQRDPYAFTRLQMWQRALAIAQAHPLGIGAGQFKYVAKKFNVETDTIVRRGKAPRTAHSALLQHLVEYGPLGALLLWGIPLWLIIAAAWRQRQQQPWLMAVLGALCIPTFVANAFFSPPLMLLWVFILVQALRVKQVTTDAECTAQKAYAHQRPVKLQRYLGPAAVGALALLTIGVLSYSTRMALTSLFLHRADAFQKSGDLTSAAHSGHTAMDFGLPNVPLHMFMASMAFRFGNLPQCEEHLLAAATLNPLDDAPWLRLGWWYERINQNKAAQQAYLQALRRNPTRAVSWLHWSNLHQGQTGRLGLQLAIRLEPYYLSALAALQKLETTKGNHSQAQQLKRRYIRQRQRLTRFEPQNEYMQLIVTPPRSAPADLPKHQ